VVNGKELELGGRERSAGAGLRGERRTPSEYVTVSDLYEAFHSKRHYSSGFNATSR